MKGSRIEQIYDWSAKKILIVEDDDFSVEYLVEVLADTNAQIIIARNGLDAIKIVKETPGIDVVLMDIQLPGLSGDKATTEIRKFNTGIPIIAQTARAMLSDREKFLDAGCNDYISKPILITDIFIKLEKFL